MTTIPIGPESWHSAVDICLFIYAEGAKGNCSAEGTATAHDEIMRCADVADAVPALVDVIQGFRWIMSTYTGAGADGPPPAPWCDDYRGVVQAIGFDPDKAIAAIDEAMGKLPRKETT